MAMAVCQGGAQRVAFDQPSQVVWILSNAPAAGTTAVWRTLAKCVATRVSLRTYQEGGSSADFEIKVGRFGWFDGKKPTAADYLVEKWDRVIVEISNGQYTAPASWGLGEVENPVVPGEMLPHRIIFAGYVTNAVEELEPDNESVQFSAMGMEFPLTGRPCIGRRYCTTAGGVPATDITAMSLIFNENNKGNFNGATAAEPVAGGATGPADAKARYAFSGPARRLQDSTTYFWSFPEMLLYTMGNFAESVFVDDTRLGYKWIQDRLSVQGIAYPPPGVGRTTLEDYPQIDISGMSVADAITAILAQVPGGRFQWWITPHGEFELMNAMTIKTGLVNNTSWTPLNGRKVSLLLPLPDTNLKDAASTDIVNRAVVNRDWSKAWNRVLMYGGRKTFDTMVTLIKGWDAALEAQVFAAPGATAGPDLTRKGSDQWAATNGKYRDVGRRYRIARDKAWDPGTAGVPIFSRAGEKCFSPEPRELGSALMSQYQETAEDRPKRYTAVLQREIGTEWRTIHANVSVRLDELGIYIEDDPPTLIETDYDSPGTWDGHATFYDLRLTFLIESDDRISAETAAITSGMEMKRAFSMGDDYRFAKVQHYPSEDQPQVEIPGSTLGYLADGVIIDDGARLAAEAVRLQARTAEGSRSSSFTIPVHSVGYKPGDYIDFVKRASFSPVTASGDVEIGSVIIGVVWELDSDVSTQILVADTRAEDGG